MIDKRICKKCGFEAKNTNEFYNHLRENHNQTFEQYILEIKFNNVYPTCKCGCGKILKFSAYADNYFSEYTTNHFPRKGHTDEIKLKIKQNTIKALQEKYNVSNIMELPEYIDKIKQTKLEKYGDSTYNNLEKNKQTKLEKYGNPNYNNAPKIIQTNLERYGAHSYTATDDGKLQVKQTKLKKYGNPNYNNPEKNRQTNLERCGFVSNLADPNWRLNYMMQI